MIQAASFLWLPSQNGLFPLVLQPHQATCFSSVISTNIGLIFVEECDPSQNGCFCDRPQAHQT